MFPFTFILNPARFFQHIVSGNSIRQGLVVFAVAALSQVLAALVYSGRVVYEVVLGPYSPAEIRLFRFDYLLMSSLTTVFVTLVVLVGIGRIVGRFLGKAQVSMRVFITATMYLFAILAMVNIVYSGLAYGTQPVTYYVLGAEFRDVVFYDVRLKWSNGTAAGRVDAELLYAKEADVERVYGDGSSIRSGVYTEEELQRILSSTGLKAVLRQPQVPPYELPASIVVEDFSFNIVEAKNTVLISVAAVLNEPSSFLVQMGLVKNFVWRTLMSAYIGIVVRTLHKTSMTTTLLTIFLAYLAVTNLVPVLF